MTQLAYICLAFEVQNYIHNKALFCGRKPGNRVWFNVVSNKQTLLTAWLNRLSLLNHSYNIIIRIEINRTYGVNGEIKRVLLRQQCGSPFSQRQQQQQQQQCKVSFEQKESKSWKRIFEKVEMGEIRVEWLWESTSSICMLKVGLDKKAYF